MEVKRLMAVFGTDNDNGHSSESNDFRAGLDIMGDFLYCSDSDQAALTNARFSTSKDMVTAKNCWLCTSCYSNIALATLNDQSLQCHCVPRTSSLFNTGCKSSIAPEEDEITILQGS